MTIRIGQKLDSDFHNPLELLNECHRRIERFLTCLIKISDEGHGGELTDSLRQQPETALRYFREAAPKHTFDEDESLFPRLKRRKDCGGEAIFTLLDRLHVDHAEADKQHRRVDELGTKWLAEGSLLPDDAEQLLELLRTLHTTYERHIAVEETQVFPLAGRVLSPNELETIGQEMAARRGLVIQK